MILTATPTTDAPTTATATGTAASGDAGAPADAAQTGAPPPSPNGAPARGGHRERAAGRSTGARPAGPVIPHADRPGAVPAPEHHHLPGWVRRDFARARPALADLLGLLQGEDRAAFLGRLEEITAGVSAGKFSLAWQYPALIEEGRTRYAAQSARLAEQQRAGRELDRARRAAATRLRDASAVIPADVAARLGRELRSAGTLEGVAAVDAEVVRAVEGARGSTSRRREREIERTRSRMLRTLPPSALATEEPAESWQDVLRRFAEQQPDGPG
ncbi:MAG TPA: hypothetical protein VI316_09625 [Candidatus Dormibacteraeota bacterium]